VMLHHIILLLPHQGTYDGGEKPSITGYRYMISFDSTRWCVRVWMWV
jgi:hypothetical protein